MTEREIKIKVCGMRHADNLADVAALRPDYVGFIFYPLSPRFVPPIEAQKMPQYDGIRRIGVFVNEKVETMLEIADSAGLFAVQLHGDESCGICAQLKSEDPELKVIKAFSVDENFEGSLLKKYESVCDYFLFDTRTEKRGGSGQNFSWEILRKFPIAKPFFLSGGIGPENVAQALESCLGLPIHAVDLNSKIEILPGVKSPLMLAEVLQKL
jgi:phosphoribosylanthranilate isomerase